MDKPSAEHRLYYEDNIVPYRALSDLSGLSVRVLLDTNVVLREVFGSCDTAHRAQYIGDHIPFTRLRTEEVAAVLAQNEAFGILPSSFGEFYGQLDVVRDLPDGVASQELARLVDALTLCRRRASRRLFQSSYLSTLDPVVDYLVYLAEPESKSVHPSHNDARLVVAARSLRGGGETVVASDDSDVAWALQTLHERREEFMSRYPEVFGSALRGAEAPPLYQHEAVLHPGFRLRRASAAQSAVVRSG